MIDDIINKIEQPIDLDRRITALESTTGIGGSTGAAPVLSVNSKTGVVVLSSADIGAYPDSNPSGFINELGNVVFTTGDQTISGTKTFASGIEIFGSGTSILFVSNSGVGINNESPSASLDVSGSVKFSERPFVGGTGVLLSGDLSLKRQDLTLFDFNLTGYAQTGNRNLFISIETQDPFISGSPVVILPSGGQNSGDIITIDYGFRSSSSHSIPIKISGYSYNQSNILSLDSEISETLHYSNSAMFVYTDRQWQGGRKTWEKIGSDATTLSYAKDLFVSLTGNQTISGTKTFANDVKILGNLEVTGRTIVNEVIDVTTTGIISGVTGQFKFLRVSGTVEQASLTVGGGASIDYVYDSKNLATVSALNFGNVDQKNEIPTILHFGSGLELTEGGGADGEQYAWKKAFINLGSNTVSGVNYDQGSSFLVQPNEVKVVNYNGTSYEELYSRKLIENLVYTTGNQTISGNLTSSVSNGNVQIPLGFSNFAYVRNLDSALSKGQVVYIAGAQGDHAAVRKASNTGEATSSKTFGIAAEPIASGADGYVITNGQLQNLNILSSFNAGDSLWLGTGAGSLTNIKPSAPNHSVFLGVVEKPGNGSNGIMYVKVQNGIELDELHDVLITSPQSGQVVYRDGDNLWKNKTFSASDVGASSHNTLSFWHSVTSTSSNGLFYFSNLPLGPQLNGRDNRIVTVNENCIAKSASWSHYEGNTGNSIYASTGYFVNLTKNTTGIISSAISGALPGQSYNFTGAINPPVQVSAGDKINIAWNVPAYLTQPTSVYNAVDVYFYSS